MLVILVIHVVSVLFLQLNQNHVDISGPIYRNCKTEHTGKIQTKDNAVKIKSIFRRKKAFGLFWQLLGGFVRCVPILLNERLPRIPRFVFQNWEIPYTVL